MKRALFVSLLLLGAAARSGAEDPRWDKVPAKDHARPNPLAGSPLDVQAGAVVYEERCAQCHRAHAEGDSRHPSLRGEDLRSRTDGDIDWFLRQGDLRHGMPSWSKLPQSQRWQLIAYLRSVQGSQ